MGCLTVFGKGKRYIQTREKAVFSITRESKLPKVLVEFGGAVNVVSEASVNMSVSDKLRQHERFGHFHVPGLEISDCSGCNSSKGQAPGHSNVRPDHLKPQEWLEQVDWDFAGPYPKSHFNNRWLLIAIEEFHGWVENYPLPTKGDNYVGLQKFISEVGLIDRKSVV